MANRFMNPLRRQFNSQYYVPEVFTPNFELFAKSLQAQQGSLDKARTLSDLPINALQGADEEYAQELRKQRYASVDNIVNVFREKGLNAGNRELRNLATQIRREELPGGESFKLNARKEQFNKFQEEQTKRLNKGEISNAQFHQSVNKALQDYNTAGGLRNSAGLNLNARQNQIKFDEFANNFLKHFHADKQATGDLAVRDGKLLYNKNTVSEIEFRKVQETLANAFRDAAGATGQLDDLFAFNNQDTDFTKDEFVTKGNDVLRESQLTLNKLNELEGGKDTKALQAFLNENFNAQLSEDGDLGRNTKAALEQAKTLAQESINNANDYLNTVSTSEARDLHRNQFITDYTFQLATPFAKAKSFKEVDGNLKSLGRTMAAERALIDYRKKTEEQEQAIVARTIPSAKAVPRDTEFYVARDGKLRKNTNSSVTVRNAVSGVLEKTLQAAGQSGAALGMNWMTGVVNVFDRLFTDNDEVSLEESEHLENIKHHMIARGELTGEEEEAVMMSKVTDRMNRDIRESIQGSFNLNTNSKFKKNFDSIFFGNDSKTGQLNAAAMQNFKFTVPTENGSRTMSGQQVTEMLKDNPEIEMTYKGSVDDWQSVHPYGSTVIAMGDQEIIMEPTDNDKNTREAFYNGMHRAKLNAQVGNIVNFEAYGRQWKAKYLPNGTYEVIDLANPDVANYYHDAESGNIEKLNENVPLKY